MTETEVTFAQIQTDIDKIVATLQAITPTSPAEAQLVKAVAKLCLLVAKVACSVVEQ